MKTLSDFTNIKLLHFNSCIGDSTKELPEIVLIRSSNRNSKLDGDSIIPSIAANMITKNSMIIHTNSKMHYQTNIASNETD